MIDDSKNLTKLKTDLEKIKHDLYGTPVPNLPAALALCQTCAHQTPVRTRLHLILYCKHNHAGAFFNELSRIWVTVCPVAREDFAFSVGVADAVITHNAQAEAPSAGERH